MTTRYFYSQQEEEIIRISIENNISEEQIAIRLKRSIFSIRRKMRSMGIKCKERKLDSLIFRQERISALERKKQKQQKLLKETEDMANSCLSDDWQQALLKARAEIKEYRGVKMYFVDGKPVSIFYIMKYMKED